MNNKQSLVADSPSLPGRPTRARINLDNLAKNFHSIRSLVGDRVAVMAVVKADAYGHGALSCAQRLQTEGAEWFGVALPEEAVELRLGGVTQPIVCLGGFWNNQETLVLRERIAPVLYHLGMAESLDRAAREAGTIADVHIKIDTGMNRLGVRFDAVREFVEQLKKFENLRVDGLLTHFAAADDADENQFTNEQIAKFETAVKIFALHGFQPTYKYLANSPGTLAHRASWGDLVRIGGALYGIGKDIFPLCETVADLRPVMQLESEITLLKIVPRGETIGYSRSFTATRDSLIATVPCGYNDGLPRALSNQGKVIVNGVYAPFVGRVSMDLIVVDVTDVPKVKLCDRVILLGEENGLRITAEDLARQSNTISYEITCGISPRVPRIATKSRVESRTT